MTHVLIAGAGPGGATLAYLLARRGLGVTLLERQRDFARAFRGEVLMPSALDALAQAGLREALAAVPGVELVGAEAWLRGRSFLRVDFDRKAFGGSFPVWTSQPALLEMLVGRAAAFDGFRLERGTSLRGLLRENGRVVGARVHDGERERELRADLMIGADGRASVVRRELAPRVRADRAGMDVVWCRVPLPAEHAADPRLRAYVGDGHFAIAGPTPEDALQIGWVIGKGRFGDLRARGVGQWLEELAGHVSPELAVHLRAHREDVSRPFLLDVVADRVEPWWRPGALLIGDAAHTMSPVGAQGINIAIRDALVAANALVPALEAGAQAGALDAACARVEAERLPELRRLQWLQSIPPRIALRDAWWARALIRVLPALGVGRRRARGPLVRWFARGVTDVKLEV